MNKKLFFAVLIILILAGVGGFVLFTNKQDPGQSGFASFFGFGKPDLVDGSGAIADPDMPGDSAIPTDETLADLPGVRKVFEAPVAGFSLFSRGNETVIRFQERARGYVYELPLLDGAASRLSSTTFPAVYESFFGKGGQATYVRTLDDADVIKTTLFTIGRDVSYTMASNIGSFAVSPDTQKAFYLVRTVNGVAGYTTSFDTTAPKNIFSSTMGEWLASWTNPTTILLGTKPAAGVPGSLSLLNTKTLGTTVTLTGIPGVTGSLSPDGKTILYTKTIDSGMETFFYTVASGVSQKAPFTTLPEKCVWSTKVSGVVFCAIPRSIPQGAYPDQWYQGAISFSDEIWKFDAASASPYGQVVVSDNVSEPLDATSLAISPDGSYLAFINRRDGGLWVVDLIQEAPDIE